MLGIAFYLANFFLAGIFLGILQTKFYPDLGINYLHICIIGLIFWPIFRQKTLFFCALVVGLLVGFNRSQIFKNNLGEYKKLEKHQMTVSGKILDDPVYAEKGQKEFHIGKIFITSPIRKELKGRIRIRTFNITDFGRGDQVLVSGNLYPGFGNRQGSISYAEVELTSAQTGFVEVARGQFFEGAYTSISEPSASLGLGFLVGLRNLLPEDLLDKLSRTGLTHIVAVSGYNLTILIRLCRRLFSRVSLKASMVSSFVFIASFILITGFSPSIVRASVVTSLALVAWYYGRKINPFTLILLGLAITSYINPFYPWLDIGWYLSFLAFFGVLILAPIIIKRIYGDKKPKLLTQILIETTCAQIMTLPLISNIFGEISVISILANILILPFVPLAMGLTFVGAIAGAVIPVYSSWISAPASFVLSYMINVVDFLSSFSWALADFKIDTFSMAVIYGFILAFVMFAIYKLKIELSSQELIE